MQNKAAFVPTLLNQQKQGVEEIAPLAVHSFGAAIPGAAPFW